MPMPFPLLHELLTDSVHPQLQMGQWACSDADDGVVWARAAEKDVVHEHDD